MEAGELKSHLGPHAEEVKQFSIYVMASPADTENLEILLDLGSRIF